MCGRFSIAKKVEDIEKRFHAEMLVEDWRPHYNAAPSQKLLVQPLDQKENIQAFRWGLIPTWAKDPAIGNKMINARSETIHSKAAFRSLIRRKRCLVVADGFYEWKKTGKGKQPYRIAFENNPLFSFAGLWDRWKDPDGRVIQSFTIITTEANRLVSSIHSRMPVIFDPEREKQWLDEKQDTDKLLKLLQSYDHEGLIIYPVSRRLNSPIHDDAKLLDRVEEDDQPGLF